MTTSSTGASYGSWPGPARTMALRVDAAVAAGRAGVADEFTAAAGDVLDLDHAQVGVLLGAVTLDLVERLYPDGLDSEGAEAVLARNGAAAAWFTGYREEPMILALLGALGVHDPDDTRPGDVAAVVTHGLLLVGDLLAEAKAALPPVLDAAMAELHRAQTVELP